ncbi:MAG: phosphoribosyl-ATP diphosphatase, partial [Alphaproteobacteria bacterium]|nr:phosphoribosyl-ATP diphosphatase [Alphaproteobacteria bacterium]
MPASPPRPRPRITHGDARVLDDLAEIIRRREGAPRSESYTARLLADGEPRIVRKLLEEANETALAALLESRAALCRESADLLYNLLVLWHARGISPEEVWKTLADRDAAHDTAAVKS